MTELCGAEHPEFPEVTCIKPLAACFVVHNARRGIEPLTWTSDRPRPVAVTNRPKVNAAAARAKAKAEAEAAEAAAKAAAAAAGVDIKVVGVDGEGDIPPEAEKAWSNSEWAGHTKVLLRRFLSQRTTRFTTAEDFWPLVNIGPDMRAMSVVVQHGLREGWMEKQDAVYLRDTYTTRDGVKFKMNKIAPYYVSKICTQAPVPQLVDGSGSNPEDASHVGSTPTGGTSSATIST